MAEFAATCTAGDALTEAVSTKEFKGAGSWGCSDKRCFPNTARCSVAGAESKRRNSSVRFGERLSTRENRTTRNGSSHTRRSYWRGNAPRWYASFESDTQDKWKLSQQGIWIEYPREVPQSASLRTINVSSGYSSVNTRFVPEYRASTVSQHRSTDHPGSDCNQS